MPISNQIPSSRLIQPGVVDSAATRPASPFEGQCIFQKDTDQLLVWNGTAWVIPNQKTQNPTGLEHVAGASFTGSTSFDVTGFSSTYLFYDLKMTISGTSAVTGVLYSGTTPRTTGYYGSTTYSSYLSQTGILDIRGNGSNFFLTDVNTNPPTLVSCTIRGIADSEFGITISGFETLNTRNITGGYSNYAGTNSYDRIRFSSAANLAGSWTLMGVRKQL